MQIASSEDIVRNNVKLTNQILLKYRILKNSDCKISRLAHRGLRKTSALASFRGHRGISRWTRGSRTRKTKIMGRKGEKKERCEGKERWAIGREEEGERSGWRKDVG